MNKEFKEIDLKGGRFTFNNDGSVAFTFSKGMLVTNAFKNGGLVPEGK